MGSPTESGSFSTALPAAVREVEDFVASAGWDQPPQLFALVPTADLIEREPGLAERIDPEATLTPIAQDSLPEDDLGTTLARIVWPDAVAGCVLTQEILMLPPEAEADLPDEEADPAAAEKFIAEHPLRREARLVAGVLRDGENGVCLLRLKSGGAEEADELIEHPDLAPNLVDALRSTFQHDKAPE
ncbi:PPA1309 family protein [Allokutzneria oryzae]|uniref:PPA1309 family protein n=1 Tax=Allokutzneria oryzae TaxID=1378989 RepID=A0ABV6A2R2_9PSEU